MTNNHETKEPMFTLADVQAEYLCGLSTGKKSMVMGLLPETVEIMIVVKGRSMDDIETIKKVSSFEDIQRSSGLVLRKLSEHAIAEIASQGLLKKVLEG